MNMDLAATLTAIIALTGYFLMRFLLPTLNYERLLFLGSFALISVFFMFMHRRQKRKKEMENK
jgi:hypothetical protein